MEVEARVWWESSSDSGAGWEEKGGAGAVVGEGEGKG